MSITEKQKATLYRMQRGGAFPFPHRRTVYYPFQKWAGSSTDRTQRRSIPQKSV
jgi:hypothetical protein